MDQIRHHFIGIGGAGMSAIATVLLEMGREVSGSDIKESRYTRSLAEKGARIFIGHRAENVDGADLVVVSSAIRPDNLEHRRAAELGIPVIRRAEMLARLGEGRRAIAVAGTHGKTTTTSMIALLMEAAGLNPTFLIGGELNDTGSNARHGKGEFLVAEADESDGSLLCLRPETAIVTNVEADHLDHYHSLEAIEEVFRRFLEGLPADGMAILCGDQPNLRQLSRDIRARIIYYGGAPDCSIRAEEIGMEAWGSSFKVTARGKKAGAVRLRVPGRHNVENALAACALGLSLDIPFGDISAALSDFKGVHRRFELLGEEQGISIVDDYAHHPTEVAATLEAASDGEWERLIALFQPHRYSRLSHLHAEFASAFARADMAVITEVYAAGEEPIPGVTGQLLVDSLVSRFPRKPIVYLANREELTSFLLGTLRRGDLLLTLGAGDVGQVGEEILSALRRDGVVALDEPDEVRLAGGLGVMAAPVGPGGLE